MDINRKKSAEKGYFLCAIASTEKKALEKRIYVCPQSEYQYVNFLHIIYCVVYAFYNIITHILGIYVYTCTLESRGAFIFFVSRLFLLLSC